MFGKKQRKEKARRFFSLAFLLAVPFNFAAAAALFFCSAALTRRMPLRAEVWSLFTVGIIAGAVIFGCSRLKRTRTLIHEIKHAVVVFLTGNIVKGIRVKKDTGRVDFEMHHNALRFTPIIALAPYFFPLFSLPCLVCCVVMEDHYAPHCALLLGAAFAADLVTAFGELHPGQSDFRSVFGGFPAAAAYLAGFHLMWTGICLIWLLGGRHGFVYSGMVLYRAVRSWL